MQEALAQPGVRVVGDTGGECDDCLLQSLSSDSAVFCIRLEHEQKVYGVLSCAVSSHFMRDEEEKSLFQEIGEDISFALNNFEMEEKQRQAEDENKELEARLRQSQKIESIGMLAGGIAHDFNNILTVVIGFSQLALEKIDKGSDLEDDLREITRAGMRAKDLISQIMTFARQTDDKISPIRMDVIVKEVVHFIRSSIPSTIEIKSNIFSKASVMGNPSQIHQIFMNLFTNAAYAMKDHGGVLGVGLEDCRLDHEAVLMYPGMKPGDYIKVMVSDTGEGIPPGIIDTIFEPYFTTKEPGEGTGLGLAVVHGIVSSYGGSISVSSQSGKGTVFTFYLPVTTKEGTQDLLESTEPTKGTERILVVDDESPIAKLNEKMLENLGYTVVSRTDSPEALELLESGPYDFDLVVTDMTMPKLTGVDLAEVMMDIRPELPFILCTGYSRKLQLNPEMPSNIRGVLNKPIQKAELADAIRKILNGS
jgi:signal transduction histidine kinase